ncbi:acyl-CoA N-acyltransferase [Lentinula raphanica]|nr:acyl-CoA N-acyltransferase [Lentinula raphanica]
MTLTIREARETDADAVSRICLLTAKGGQSADDLHDFKELPGLTYAVPYVKLPTTLGFVLVDDHNSSSDDDPGEVVGYVLASRNSREFDHYTAEHWWPALAEKYPPSLAKKPADKEFMEFFSNPHGKSDARVSYGAANMHINMLEPYQRQGWGSKLIGKIVEALRKEDPDGGVTLGMDPRNLGVRAFYEKFGFESFEGGKFNELGLKFSKAKNLPI